MNENEIQSRGCECWCANNKKAVKTLCKLNSK